MLAVNIDAVGPNRTNIISFSSVFLKKSFTANGCIFRLVPIVASPESKMIPKCTYG